MTTGVTFGEPLQEWMNEHLLKADDKLYFKNAGVDQACFFRDRIHGLFIRGSGDERYEQRKAHPVRVVSTHRSKSVQLPVYRIVTDDLVLTARANFYDWKLSVETTHPVPDLFHSLIRRDEQIRSIYCEGFETGWVFGPFSERMSSPSRFTVEISSEYPVWAFCYLLSVGLGIR